jgi:hypothetical protein
MADDGKWDFVPFPLDPAAIEQLVAANRAGVHRMKNSYWFAHRLLNSNAKAFYGDVYNIPQSLERFDVVMIGQILVHLRDPIAALTSATRLADTVILTEGMTHLPIPLAQFYPRAKKPDVNYSWWRYSVGLYRQILGILGFEITHLKRSKHRCLVAGEKPWTKLTTIVAHRKK